MSTPSKYCHNCGSELPPGATYCPKCGTSVYVSPPSSTGAPPPSTSTPSPSQPPSYYDRRERRRQEKEEKSEKSEKGEKGEKGGGGIIGPIIGGGILIWLGISFYLQQIGYFPSGNWWAFFIVGIGLILILLGILLYSRSRRPVIGYFIGGGILVLIGLSFLYNSLGNLWPLILVLIGIAILASAFTARRRTPNPA